MEAKRSEQMYCNLRCEKWEWESDKTITCDATNCQYLVDDEKEGFINETD